MQMLRFRWCIHGRRPNKGPTVWVWSRNRNPENIVLLLIVPNLDSPPKFELVADCSRMWPKLNCASLCSDCFYQGRIGPKEWFLCDKSAPLLTRSHRLNSVAVRVTAPDERTTYQALSDTRCLPLSGESLPCQQKKPSHYHCHEQQKQTQKQEQHRHQHHNDTNDVNATWEP